MIAKWIAGGALVGTLAAVGSWWFDGAPVDAGTVRLDGAGAREAPAATSGPDLAAPAPRERVEVEHDDAPRPVADPGLGAIVHGRVTDEDGAPVVRAIHRHGPAGASPNSPTEYTSAAGSFALYDLEPGAYAFEVRGDGFLTHRSEFVVAGPGVVVHDVQLERAASIPVRFEDREGNAHDVDEFDDDFGSFVGLAVTDERPGEEIAGSGSSRHHGRPNARFVVRGIFGSDDLPADLPDRYQGLLVLEEPLPQWVSATYRDAVLESRLLDAPVAELVFVVDEVEASRVDGSVRVRVVDRDSGELVERDVTLVRTSGGRGFEASVDDDALLFTDVPPGRYDLMLGSSLPGVSPYEYVERRVDVPRGREIDLGTLLVGRAEPFEVHLVDESGAPVRARVRAVRRDLTADDTDIDQRFGIGVGEDGVATVRTFAPGLTLVRAGGDEGRALVGVEVDTSVVDPVVLTVPKGVDVTFEFVGRPEGETRVLENAAGVPLVAGHFELVTLAPGTHALVAYVDGVETARTTFVVGGEPSTVTWGEE